jgi:hypothetical protein
VEVNEVGGRHARFAVRGGDHRHILVVGGAQNVGEGVAAVGEHNALAYSPSGAGVSSTGEMQGVEAAEAGDSLGLEDGGGFEREQVGQHNMNATDIECVDEVWGKIMGRPALRVQEKVWGRHQI